MIDTLLQYNLLPDALIRFGIRRLLAERLREQAAVVEERGDNALLAYAAELSTRPVAEQTDAANEQHYELSAEFFELCLGRRRKYSSCLFTEGIETLDAAEEAMLDLYVERAELTDGQRILDLGCGWGSLTLFLAERFPRAKITAVSNSSSQRIYIEEQCRKAGLSNVDVITCDVNTLTFPRETFDRIVSVEMLEHVKNYRELLARIASWLRPDGRLFVHIFTHVRYAYHYVARDSSDWMARYFFTGGQMPAHGLLPLFQDHLHLCRDWVLSGEHYRRTAEAWLENMDRHREQILEIFSRVYGEKEKRKWWVYWRVFFMSCAELWGYRGGREWVVSHYLFERAPAGAAHPPGALKVEAQ
ncbi:MAG: class I SAM-dependent methyltransferase [Verrucomicrobia bacterium]|nr:MAG: class I SAM-dependent methyltransferase [Verrucomicrobiota bacterium]